MWIEATWQSPPGHSAPATQRPAGIPSRTIYGLIAYLCQIAERISSDPFDPSPSFLLIFRQILNPFGVKALCKAKCYPNS